jgi:hypothetical protein
MIYVHVILTHTHTQTLPLSLSLSLSLAVCRIDENPNEAKIWVTSSGKDNALFSWDVWRRLPLHEVREEFHIIYCCFILLEMHNVILFCVIINPTNYSLYLSLSCTTGMSTSTTPRRNLRPPLRLSSKYTHRI